MSNILGIPISRVYSIFFNLPSWLHWLKFGYCEIGGALTLFFRETSVISRLVISATNNSHSTRLYKDRQVEHTKFGIRFQNFVSFKSFLKKAANNILFNEAAAYFKILFNYKKGKKKVFLLSKR